MLWHNNKYNLFLSRGCANLKLDRMFGVIQQLIVVPENKDTVWSLKLFDGDMDIIYENIDYEGRLDNKDEIPIGNQSGEMPTISIYDSTSNEKFRVIIKVREIV